MSLFSSIFKHSPLRKTLLGGLVHKGVEGLQKGELAGGLIHSKGLERIGKDVAGLPGMGGTFSPESPGRGIGASLGPAGLSMPDADPEVRRFGVRGYQTPDEAAVAGAEPPIEPTKPPVPLGRPGQFSAEQQDWLQSLNPEDQAKELAHANAGREAHLASKAREVADAQPKRLPLTAMPYELPKRMPGSGMPPGVWNDFPTLPPWSSKSGSAPFDWSKVVSIAGPGFSMPMMNAGTLEARKQLDGRAGDVRKKVSALVGRVK